MSTTPTDTLTAAECKLLPRLRRRFAVEAEFARLRHTHRHGPLHHFYDKNIQRPGLTFALTLVGLFGQGKRNALSPVVRTVRLEFEDLPAAFEGFRLMHLSDFHIDGVDGLTEVLAHHLQQLSCDVCVMTGDYRFEDRGPCEEVYPRMRKLVESIRSERGVYGILGNHDPSEMAPRLQNLGINMLVNDSARISKGDESVWIVGLDDNFDFGCHDLEIALADVPKDGFKILLAHAPELYEEANRRGIHLNLSGHTHGGQLRLPWIGALTQNARCPKAYSWGAWRHGKLQGYTSCGVGCSAVPIRFNCPPEIVVLELHRVR